MTTPTWLSFKKIRAIKFINSMHIWLIITPICAKLLHKVNSNFSVNIFNNKYELTIDLGIPFSWELFYFSAVLFTISNIIYAYKCPNIVKDNDHYNDFVANGKNIKHLYEYQNKEIDDKYIYTSRFSKDDEYKKEEIETFWNVFNIDNSSHALTRKILLIMYGIAFIFIGVVFLQNFLFVIKILF